MSREAWLEVIEAAAQQRQHLTLIDLEEEAEHQHAIGDWWAVFDDIDNDARCGRPVALFFQQDDAREFIRRADQEMCVKPAFFVEPRLLVASNSFAITDHDTLREAMSRIPRSAAPTRSSGSAPSSRPPSVTPSGTGDDVDSLGAELWRVEDAAEGRIRK